MKIQDIFSSTDNALSVLKKTRDAAAISAAITSMTIVFTIAYGSAAEYMPRFLAYIIGVCVVAMVAYVVDYGFRQTLPLGLDLLISGHAWNDWRIFMFMALLLCWNFVQGFSSIKLSWEGRKEAVAIIQKEPEIENVAQIKMQVDRVGSAKIRAIDSEIDEIEQKITQKEQEVEHMYPIYMDNIEAGRDKWGWNAKQLTAKKTSATASLERQLEALAAARTKAIEAETENSKVTVSSIAAHNENVWNDYQISKTRNMAYIGYFGSGCTIAVFVISLMIALLGQSEVKEIEQREVVSPVKKAVTPPHVAPARAETVGDFETARAIEMLRAETETLRRETETLRRKPETVEMVSPETETAKGPKTVSVSDTSPFEWNVETVKHAVKEAVREERPETVETVRETVETELKRKPETVVIETVKHAPPIRQKNETVRETVETVRLCLNCSSDISSMRSTAKFCGAVCKNKYHNAKR